MSSGELERLQQQGCEAFARGEHGEAEACFAAARALAPADPQPLLNLGSLALVQDRVGEALEALRRCVELAPLNPGAYFAVGLILERRGALALAREFFARTLQLQPGYPGARERWRPEEAADGPGTSIYAPLAELLRVRPLPRLSACLIVRDEELFLPHCLERIWPVADEIVVVDTGSIDGTVAIAEGFGAKVVRHPWRDDFSDARNVSLAHATGDWILVLDADELLDPAGYWELQSLLWRGDVIGWNLVIENLVGEEAGQGSNVFYAFRLFQNGRGLHFVGELHEQVLPSAARTGLPQAFSEVRVAHYGYLKPVLDARAKGARNLTLARSQTDREPENPYAQYQLANTYRHLEQHAEAVATYRHALALLPAAGLRELPYAPHLFFGLAESCRQAGLEEEAREACRQGIALFPDYPDLLYTLAYTEMEQGLLAESEAHFRRCLGMEERVFSSGAARGTTGHLAWNALGAVYFRMGRLADAEAALQRALTERPRNDTEPLLNLGKLHLHQERWAEALARFTEALELKPEDAAAWQHSARALLMLGHLADARVALERCQALAPELGETHHLLGQIALRERRHAEAAAAFARELERDPDHPGSLYGAGVACFLAGDPAGASPSWERFAACHPADARAWVIDAAGLLAGPVHGPAAAAPPDRHDAAAALLAELVAQAMAAGALPANPALARQLIGLRAAYPGLVDRLGVHLSQLVEHEQLDALCYELLRAGPGDPAVYYWLGRGCQRRRDLGAAALFLRQCLRLDASHGPAGRLLENLELATAS